MVVPLHKKWEASGVRVQVLEKERSVQLLIFFQGDFAHADCLNFKVTPTDVFEKTEKGKQPALRLVDAKFALPGGKGEGRGESKVERGVKGRFANLDLLEYPGEHDDITLGFESVQGKFFYAQPLQPG